MFHVYVYSLVSFNYYLLFAGRASIYILRTAFGVDWSERIKIIYAGDDATDEEAMLVCQLWSPIKLNFFHKIISIPILKKKKNLVLERYGGHVPCNFVTHYKDVS